MRPVAWPHGRARDGGIDQIPVDGVAGALFLCGKHAVGPDPDALLARVEGTTIVCLNEGHELDDRYPAYVAWLVTNATRRAVHHPIPDFTAPALGDLAALVEDLYQRMVDGERVVVTCGGGIGRAGTIGAAVLMRAGVPRADAIATVRAHRPMAGPETGPQSDVLEAFERELNAARRGRSPEDHGPR